MVHRREGRIHWTFWLFVIVGIAFVLMAVAPFMSEMRKPAYERAGDDFIRALARGEFPSAEKQVDSNALPEDKKDVKAKWNERMSVWGQIEGIEMIDSVPAPNDLKHPKASEGYRLEYHLKGYLTVGTAFVYVVPQNGNWKVVDYEFR